MRLIWLIDVWICWQIWNVYEKHKEFIIVYMNSCLFCKKIKMNSLLFISSYWCLSFSYLLVLYKNLLCFHCDCSFTLHTKIHEALHMLKVDWWRNKDTWDFPRLKRSGSKRLKSEINIPCMRLEFQGKPNDQNKDYVDVTLGFAMIKEDILIFNRKKNSDRYRLKYG